MRACPSRRRELAEMVDGALGLRELERLNAHLVGCSGCRAEAASLRAVRDRVRDADDRPPSAALTSRLLSIAGDEADRPLYARPFDRAPAGALPSRRRRARQAVLGAMTITCLLLAGLVGVGWTAAPPTRTPALDPGPLAREEFASILGENALANPALVAARAAEGREDKTGALTAPAWPQGPFAGAGAREWLQRADEARLRTAHAGEQLVQVRHLAGYWVTKIMVESQPGRSTRVHFPDRTGAEQSRLLPPVQQPAGIDGLAGHYELVTAPGDAVAGRPVVVVEARRAGVPAARWWIDTATALVLWQQALDATGAVTLSAGYRSIAIGPVADPSHLPPRLAPHRTTANLTLSSVGALQVQGWSCQERVAGLDLVRMRGDRAEAMLHTAYGDGITTLSVLQQKGALTGAPEGFVWDPRMRAYRSLGLTTMYAWQSGDTVFTVVTDGPAELADRAVAELPHAQPVLRTRTDRVLDGWKRLMGVGG